MYSGFSLPHKALHFWILSEVPSSFLCKQNRDNSENKVRFALPIFLAIEKSEAYFVPKFPTSLIIRSKPFVCVIEEELQLHFV